MAHDISIIIILSVAYNDMTNKLRLYFSDFSAVDLAFAHSKMHDLITLHKPV